MSGHSKWSTIKHKKGAADAKRGKLFSKLAKEIIVAAKSGGGDPSGNIRLRAAIQKARSESMPNKNIENAIKSGVGDKSGANYEEVSYEGYGPEGVAILIRCLTDNRNRTVADVRSTLSKHGGNLGENGSVAWQFQKRGVVHVLRSVMEEAAFLDVALECDAEDVIVEDEGYVVYVQPGQLETFRELLGKKLHEHISKKADNQGEEGIASAEVIDVAKNNVKLPPSTVQRIEKLVGLLDDLDDVQNVSTNHQVE